jgi:hypothetical protein
MPPEAGEKGSSGVNGCLWRLGSFPFSFYLATTHATRRGQEP